MACQNTVRVGNKIFLVQIQQVLREVEDDYRKEVVERLVAMGRAVPKGVDPLDIVLEPEKSRFGGVELWGGDIV